MGAGAVHYELFVRRRPADDWALDHVGEGRQAMLADAEAALAERRAAAVRLVKERYDEATGRFSSVVVLEKGEPAPKRASATRRVDAAPPCTGPADLHTAHARERIGRLLEPFLLRRRVTPWELLHRPDLAEDLEASGAEVLGAVQRLAVAEAQARGVGVHEMVRAFQTLADRALERLVREGRRRVAPEVDAANFAVTAGRLAGHADGVWLLSLGVAGRLADAGWAQKLALAAELLESAPQLGPARSLAHRVLEPLLTELLAGPAPLEAVLPGAPDPGARLGVLTRLAAPGEAAQLAGLGGDLLRGLPELDGALARLGERIGDPAFTPLQRALAGRVLRELDGPRRLRPSDPDGEIELLRALAAVLTTGVGRLVAREDVQAAFTASSRRLVSADFVALFTARRGSALAEARALVRLCENVTGVMNKRQGARWLLGVLQSLRFETEVRAGPETPSARLAALAGLQRAAAGADLPEPEGRATATRIGEAGGWVEADAGVAAAIARSGAPPLVRAAALARLAAGEAAPLGPAADRARDEALRLLRRPEVRAAMAGAPETDEILRGLAAR